MPRSTPSAAATVLVAAGCTSGTGDDAPVGDTFIAFATSGVTIIKMLGIGVALAVSVTLVSTLVLGEYGQMLFVVTPALIGACVWNIITWYYGIPSSSTHALIGGLAGAKQSLARRQRIAGSQDPLPPHRVQRESGDPFDALQQLLGRVVAGWFLRGGRCHGPTVEPGPYPRQPRRAGGQRRNG